MKNNKKAVRSTTFVVAMCIFLSIFFTTLNSNKTTVEAETLNTTATTTINTTKDNTTKVETTTEKKTTIKTTTTKPITTTTKKVETTTKKDEVKRNDNKEYYTLKCKITHYCSCSKCCGKSDGITASGKKVKANHTIAVDKRVIPLGSKVEINGHIYYAEDTGVSGNTIDIYVNSHSEAYQKGVYYTTVKVYK